MGEKQKPIPHPKAVQRGREHLTQDEARAVIRAASQVGREGPRDALMLSMMYRHGLRVTELCRLKRGQVDLDRKRIMVKRLKKGDDGPHPLDGKDEVRPLRALWRKHPDSPHVFTSTRGGAMDRTVIYKIVERAGQRAGLPFAVHPHMFRHSCGFKLASVGKDTRRIQEYLGHRNIQTTVRYTALADNKFDDIWDD